MDIKVIAAKNERTRSIENTKNGFEESFKIGTFYNRQTQDKAHLERILHCLKISDGMRILDLGTGMGYFFWPIQHLMMMIRIDL